MDENNNEEEHEQSRPEESESLEALLAKERREEQQERGESSTTNISPAAVHPTFVFLPHSPQIAPTTFRIRDKIGCSSDGRIPVHFAEKIVLLSREESEILQGSYYSIKLVQTSSEELYRSLKTQARVSQAVTHTNILGIDTKFNYENYFCVVFPLIDIGSLRFLSTTKYPYGFPEDAVIVALHETLKALSFIHSKGRDHRKISAGHIFINTKGEILLGYSATLFELIEDYNSEEYNPLGDWVSVPKASEDTQKADVYLLGVTALELAYGTQFFKFSKTRRSAIESMVQKINQSKKLPNKSEIYNHDDEASTSTAAASTSTQDQGQKKKKKPVLKLFMKSFFKIREGESRDFSKEFEKLVVKCLAQEPAKRPTADKLLKKKIFTKKSKDVAYFHNLVREED